MLALREQVYIESTEQNMGQNLRSNENQEDAVVIVTSVPVPFALAEMDNGSILKFR